MPGLADGNVALTHDGLATLTPWRSVIYVRDLLISSGVLPPVDRFRLLFEQWLNQWLDTITDAEHHKILRRFATWHVLRHLCAVADVGPIGPGLALADLNQAQLDHWYAAASDTEKNMLRPFLIWLSNRRRSLRLRVPTAVRAAAAPVDQRQRLAVIQRVHNDHTIELGDRLVALLILLYAQPLPRIVQLTVDDVLRDNDQVLLRLGDPPAPVPASFDQVLTDYLASRPNRTTATNSASNWLFPGRRADQPLHPGSLRLRMNTLGVPVLNGRTAAIRHMLQEAPASVVAGMLGYQLASAENIAAAAGVRWQRYTADRVSKP